MKAPFKILSTIIAVVLITNIIACDYNDDSSSWYIKRNGNQTPDFPGDAQMLSEYNVYYVDKKAVSENDKVLYLTFDAGYENGNISEILDVLKDENVSAAFFILNNLVYKNTSLVIRMAEEGHTVCNHTAHHKDISNLSNDEICNELSSLERIYQLKIGKNLSHYFRFPEGKYSLDSVKKINDLGYKTNFWSFGYEDWDNGKQPSHDYAYEKIISNTHPGEIVLLHPTSKTNADVLPKIIKKWKSMGYRFGTLDELVERNSL